MKNIPFLNWIKTPEGAWTMLRLLSFLVFPICIYADSSQWNGSIISMIIIGFGALIMIKMGYVFFTRKEFKTMLDGSKGNKIVTDGLFKYTRHPFYFGFWILYIGILSAFHGFYLLCVVILYTALTFIVMHKEEYRLTKDFAEYDSYIKNTPVFFPVKFISFLKTLFIG